MLFGVLPFRLLIVGIWPLWFFLNGIEFGLGLGFIVRVAGDWEQTFHPIKHYDIET
jgi:hypothetical protein